MHKQFKTDAIFKKEYENLTKEYNEKVKELTDEWVGANCPFKVGDHVLSVRRINAKLICCGEHNGKISEIKRFPPGYLSAKEFVWVVSVVTDKSKFGYTGFAFDSNDYANFVKTHKPEDIFYKENL